MRRLKTIRDASTKPAERAFLKELEKGHLVPTPTEKNWSESGQILAKMYADKGLLTGKFRDPYFDVLIALTVRRAACQRDPRSTSNQDTLDFVE